MVRTILFALALTLGPACQQGSQQSSAPAVAAEQAVPLPAPRKDAPTPLMKALADRHSTRDYRGDDISEQQLSDLLWAAFGLNRDDGGRTAPSAYGNREIDVYVVMEKGSFRYDATAHGLVTVVPDDLRALTGTQGFVADAPLNLVYVADFDRMERISDTDKEPTAMTDAGFIGQNVYLLCAAEGLGTVFRGSVNKAPLATALGLSPSQRIVAAQTVGLAAD